MKKNDSNSSKATASTSKAKTTKPAVPSKPATPRATPAAGAASPAVSITPSKTSPPPAGGYTPIYLNFSNKPRAILDNMDAITAQADKLNTTRTRWSKAPRLLFWLGLGLMLIEGLFFLLGYDPSCAFVTGGVVLWAIAIFLSVRLKRSQVNAFAPQFRTFEDIVHTLRDDLRPGTGFIGSLDLTGVRQSSKVARSAKDARGRTVQYFRDQWLNFKAKMYDGNILRVSAIQRLKERNGYWGTGKVSGKSKWKPAKFKGSYQELKVRIAVNAEMYNIARNSEIGAANQIGEFTINAVDTEGGIITVLATSPKETVSAESVLGVLKFAYGLLQLKKA